jgi:hypothetical protein
MTTNYVILSKAKNPSGNCAKGHALWLEIMPVACLCTNETYLFTTLKGILHSLRSFRMTWLKGFFPRYARSDLS